MRRRFGWVIATLVVVSLAACSGGVHGPVVEANRGSGGDGAEVFGVLVVEGSCSYLVWTEPETRYPVIWPHGTDWNPEVSAVVLPDGRLVYEGDEVYGGGGYHTSDFGRFTNQQGVDLVMSCVDNEFGEVAVFNPLGDVEFGPPTGA
jgi:hypothetical protein